MLFLTATMHLNHSTARNLMQYGLDSLYFPFFTPYKVHANDEYFLDQYSDVASFKNTLSAFSPGNFHAVIESIQQRVALHPYFRKYHTIFGDLSIYCLIIVCQSVA